MPENEGFLPFQRLIVAGAGALGEPIRLAFLLDNSCAAIARGAREPMMAQIRLAWWRDALRPGPVDATHRAPLADAIRAHPRFASMREGLVALVDGWEELVAAEQIDEDGLARHADGRGGGLFAAALSGDGAAGVRDHGAVWALWDLAGHVGDDALRDAAIAAGRARISVLPRLRLPRGLAMLAQPAVADLRRGRGAPPDITPGLYLRMLRIQILGR